MTEYGRWWGFELYSAWSGSASFTPCHILWWTEAAQHAQILWEILVFSTSTLNPHRHSLLRKANDCRLSFWVPVCWYVKEVCLQFCHHYQEFCLSLSNHDQSTGIVDSELFQWINWLMCTWSDLIQKPSKPFRAEYVCQFDLDEILPTERCLMSDVHMSHCLSLCQILLVWASAN